MGTNGIHNLSNEKFQGLWCRSQPGGQASFPHQTESRAVGRNAQEDGRGGTASRGCAVAIDRGPPGRNHRLGTGLEGCVVSHHFPTSCCATTTSCMQPLLVPWLAFCVLRKAVAMLGAPTYNARCIRLVRNDGVPLPDKGPPLGRRWSRMTVAKTPERDRNPHYCPPLGLA